jgi:sugar lactone lactonase YvrE
VETDRTPADEVPAGTAGTEAAAGGAGQRVPVLDPVPGWGSDLPDLTGQDVSDVTVDGADEVYLLFRDRREVIVCAPDGTPLRTIGAGVLGPRAHGVTVAVDGRVYVVDEGAHRVCVFDPDGRLLETFGSGPSNPAFAGPVTGDLVDHISRGYPPFTRPTRVALGAGGDCYVSDGYGNCRLHRFAPDRTLVRSWGEPGTGPGRFHVPHDVYLDQRGRMLVCDRENDRIQVFDAAGDFVAEWTDLHRPQAVVQAVDGIYCVAEGAWRSGHVSRVHGPVGPAASRVSLLADGGRVLARVGDEPDEAGRFVAAHGIAVDSAGDLYVAEVSRSVLATFPELGQTAHTAVHKLRRTA